MKSYACAKQDADNNQSNHYRPHFWIHDPTKRRQYPTMLSRTVMEVTTATKWRYSFVECDECLGRQHKTLAAGDGDQGFGATGPLLGSKPAHSSNDFLFVNI